MRDSLFGTDRDDRFRFGIEFYLVPPAVPSADRAPQSGNPF